MLERSSQLFASIKAQDPHVLDQTSCLALGHSLFILLLGNFLLLDVPRVGDTVNGPIDKELREGAVTLGQIPLRR